MQSVVLHHTALPCFVDGLSRAFSFATRLGGRAAQVQIVFQEGCFFAVLEDSNDDTKCYEQTKQNQNDFHRELLRWSGNQGRRNRLLATALRPLRWAFLRAGRTHGIGEPVQRKKTSDCEYQVYLFHGLEVGIGSPCVKMVPV